MNERQLKPLEIPNMLPSEIVDHLNQFIIGQDDAKKAVAVALRNRYRRSRLPEELQAEISPSNLIMIGPTGVGKTEIVRRVSSTLGAPYVKVEATKFTEVGYVGRDVESMVRDLAEASVRLVRENKTRQVQAEAEQLANERLVDLLVPNKRRMRDSGSSNPFEMIFGNMQGEEPQEDPEEARRKSDQRTIFKEKLRRYELEDQTIEVEIEEKPMSNDLLASTGMDQVMDNMNDMMKNIMPGKKKKRRVTVAEARRILTEQEAEKLIDSDQVNEEAIQLAENHGIIFIDEIDKIAGGSGQMSGPDVSREGVQRDILPIVEGSVVKTKYGNLSTEHVLFIAAGAFHVSKPEDLIPELQGRFPVKVRLNSLREEDFKRILTEPKHARTKQYRALLETDGCRIEFGEDAIDEIARIAYTMNESEQDLGARRLTTVLEQLLRGLLFHAGEKEENLLIDKDYVQTHLAGVLKENDISKFLL